MVQIRTFSQEPGKIWAVTPKPEFGTFFQVAKQIREVEDVLSLVFNPTHHRSKDPIDGRAKLQREITAKNLNDYLRYSIIGLGSTEDVAEARLRQAVDHPRPTNERAAQVELAIVDKDYPLGTLAAVAFISVAFRQPREFLVESFIGDMVEPEVLAVPFVSRRDIAPKSNDFQILNKTIIATLRSRVDS